MIQFLIPLSFIPVVIPTINNQQEQHQPINNNCYIQEKVESGIYKCYNKDEWIIREKNKKIEDAEAFISVTIFISVIFLLGVIPGFILEMKDKYRYFNN